jgi:hypothetical protein
MLAKEVSVAGAWAAALVSDALARLPVPDHPLLSLPPAQQSLLAVETLSVSRAGGFIDVTAVIRNPTAVSRPLGTVEILLVDRDGGALEWQRMRVQAGPLQPGERRQINLALADPSGRAKGAALRLQPARLAVP